MAESLSRQSTGPPPAGQTSAAAAAARPSGLARLALPASMVMSFLAASSAPTPPYATYAGEWHFSPITTTVIFGSYAITVPLALLVLGRVSDHVGRRPVLLAAFAVQVVATVVLAAAGGVGALLVPELAVPRGTRGPVLAAAPILFAVWALSDLYGSLGPALARQLSGSASAVIGGLAFFLLAVIASLTAVALRRVPPRTVMLCGICGHGGSRGGHAGRRGGVFGGRILRQHRRGGHWVRCRTPGRLPYRYPPGAPA